MSFKLYVEQRDKEEIKHAIFVALGVNPEHSEDALDDPLRGFANKDELKKLGIMDTIDPDIKAHAISAIEGGDTTLRDFIEILTRDSVEPAKSADVEDMEPAPPGEAAPLRPSEPSPF
jgi:hypothetical protein